MDRMDYLKLPAGRFLTYGEIADHFNDLGDDVLHSPAWYLIGDSGELTAVSSVTITYPNNAPYVSLSNHFDYGVGGYHDLVEDWKVRSRHGAPIEYKDIVSEDGVEPSEYADHEANVLVVRDGEFTYHVLDSINLYDDGEQFDPRTNPVVLYAHRGVSRTMHINQLR